MNIDTETPLIELETETEGIYGNLTGKPSINGTVINGNKSGTDYGLAEKSYIDSRDEANLVLAKDYTDLSVAGLATENYADQADATTLLNAKAYTDALLTDKQDKLVAGANINISGRVISAAGTSDTWELIAEGSVTESVNSLIISQDTQGNDFNLKKIWLRFEWLARSAATGSSYVYAPIKIGTDSHNLNEVGQMRLAYDKDGGTTNYMAELILEKQNKWAVVKNIGSGQVNGINNFNQFTTTYLSDIDLNYLDLHFGNASLTFNYKLFGVRV